MQLHKDFKLVSSRPARVDDYVNLMNNLRELTSRMDEYSTTFHETERLGILMEEHRIKFPERNRNKLKETQGLMLDTKRAMVEAFESSQKYKLVFRRELCDVEVPLLKMRIEALAFELASVNGDRGVDETCRKLSELGDEIKKARERGILLNSFERFMDLSETRFEEVAEVYEEWQIKDKLW